MLSKKPGPRTRCTSTQACRTDDATASTSPAGSSKFLASLASWRSIPSHRLAHAKRCGLAASSAALADGFPAGNRSNPLRRGTSRSRVDLNRAVARLDESGSAEVQGDPQRVARVAWRKPRAPRDEHDALHGLDRQPGRAGDPGLIYDPVRRDPQPEDDRGP